MGGRTSAAPCRPGPGQKGTHPNRDGQTFFDLTYLTGVFDAPLTLEALRGDAELTAASFLKAGAAGTVFPLTSKQADHLLRLAKQDNASARGVEWGTEPAQPDVELPTRALSIKQPWAELILRGPKTIEVRSRRTHVRGRLQIYASLGDVAPDTQARVLKVYGVDAREPPRGVLVGTVEIADCRPLKVSDSPAAAFPVERATTDYAWLLAHPLRAKQSVKPKNHPQPVILKTVLSHRESRRRAKRLRLLREDVRAPPVAYRNANRRQRG